MNLFLNVFKSKTHFQNHVRTFVRAVNSLQWERISERCPRRRQPWYETRADSHSAPSGRGNRMLWRGAYVTSHVGWRRRPGLMKNPISPEPADSRIRWMVACGQRNCRVVTLIFAIIKCKFYREKKIAIQRNAPNHRKSAIIRKSRIT